MPWRALLMIAAAALAVAAALGLLSHAVVQADREARAAETARLALWRLDARATALVVAEAGRPPAAFRSFVHGEDAAGRPVLLPSPLLDLPAPPTWLHLLTIDGRTTSPQVPPAGLRHLAAGLVDDGALAEAGRRLDATTRRLGRAGPPPAPAATAAPMPAAAAAAPAESPTPASFAGHGAGAASGAAEARRASADDAVVAAEPAAAPAMERIAENESTQDRKTERNRGLARDQAPPPAAKAAAVVAETENGAPAPIIANAVLQGADAQDFANRREAVETLQRQSQAQNSGIYAPRAPAAVQKKAAAAAPAKDRRADAPLRTDLPADHAGPVAARWLDGDLLLVRSGRLDGRPAELAALVAWAPLAAELTAAITDLLPQARLRPAAAGDTLVLAALPVALDPGPLPARALGATARWTLAGAWTVGLAGLAAAGLLALAAQRLAERRAAFVSAVTHELRTPLTALRLHGDLLADPRIAGDPARRDRPVAAVRAEAARLAHLIDNVLDYARLERRRPPQPQAVRLDELLAPLLPRLGERLAAAGLSLAVAPPPPLAVRCDPAAVERILVNLVDNAAKYAAGAQPATVELSLHQAGGRAELRLRDHGPGLAADVRRRLFVPFARSAEAAAGAAPGVGLGLALCRRLARAQGGDLVLEDPHGGGLTAMLTLPLAG